MEDFESLYKIKKIIDTMVALIKEVKSLTSDEYQLLINVLLEIVKEKEKNDD